jgi:hypothetical protein
MRNVLTVIQLFWNKRGQYCGYNDLLARNVYNTKSYFMTQIRVQDCQKRLSSGRIRVKLYRKQITLQIIPEQ